jgi:hypothetical protein
MAFLLKFPEFHVTPIRLEIVALPNKNAAYMPREDMRLKVENSEPERTGMPEKKQRETEKDNEFLI